MCHSVGSTSTIATSLESESSRVMALFGSQLGVFVTLRFESVTLRHLSQRLTEKSVLLVQRELGKIMLTYLMRVDLVSGL